MSCRHDLIEALEPDQLTAALERPLPRRRVGTSIFLLLAALRLYVILAIPIVCYAFIQALHS